jgi:hypothetical protein
MINLIPPTEKKHVSQEYWIRVISVWCYLWSAALFGGVLIMVPAYVLINSQVSVYRESVKTASEKVANFEDVSSELASSSQRATKLVNGFKQPLVSEKMTAIRALETNGISFSEITVSRTDNVFAPITITGGAESRQALADFRTKLLELPGVESVDLPISSLKNDRDIQFTLSVAFKKETS